MDNNLRLAKEIMSHVGGVGNIASLNHCSTRLRLRVNHEENFDVEAIKKIDGVLDVVKAIGGFQIIVGNNVSKVYAAIVANYDVKVGEEGGRVAGNVFEVVLNVLSDIMGPAIPAIVAAGLFSALATIGKLLGLAEESTTYQIIYSVSQAPLYFLPFIVAYTSAKHWKLNPVMTIALAGVLNYPSFTALVEAGTPITLFGLPVTAASYASSLIPMILTCWAMSYVNRFIEKYCPDSIRYVMVPFFSMMVMVPVMLCVTGPAGSWVGTLMSYVITWLNNTMPGAAVLFVGIITPFLVLTGSHLALLPLVMTEFATLGFDGILFPAFIGMNFSQFAVSLAVFLKAKNKSLKSTAFSTGLTAFLTGTTEPALYGLCLRLKKPLIATFIGCAANGLYCAITRIVTYAFGAPGFFTMLNFLDLTGARPNNFYLSLGAVAVTIIVTFAATWLLGFDESGFEDETKKADSAPKKA
ncbi:PTS transporter subunit EIIC [Holdemania filiformis]|uniref:PTS transporter subunit EIIC n=1 Tax=Holdemania filiformis TaxID=61171 RepID=UPI0024306296|nr:PTS transporter subunit EIIC [Holdemania filiformis]